MHNKSKLTLIIGILLSALLLGTAATAAQKTDLVSLFNPPKIVVNSSYISPLVELFGDISVGKQVFIASNTIVRADPQTRICIKSETNLQDNILFLAQRNTPAPAAQCGRRSSSTGDCTEKNNYVRRLGYR